MASRGIVDRLDAGDVLLMDGATGSELVRRGADLTGGQEFEDAEPTAPNRNNLEKLGVRSYLRESDPASMRRVHEEFLRQLGPWSAPANVTAPETVGAIHEDYLRLGADIVISNNFWTTRSKLERLGRGDEWETHARAGAELAVAARDAVNPDAYVVAGMAPSSDPDLLRQEYEEQARLLADSGVDALLPEYLGAIDECATAVEACTVADLPVMVGVRHVSEDGTMQYRESFEALAEALEGLPVAAVLLMCSDPAHVSVSLPKLRAAFDGPIGAYSHHPQGEPSAAAEAERFAAYADEWVSQGAQIVGGCCGTRPEHIAAAAPKVKGRQRSQ